MLKKWIRSLLLPLTVTLAGCSQTLSIQALKPAEVDRAASLKQVAILPFEHDKGQNRMNMAAKLEAGLANYRIEDRPYFTVVSRSELTRILDEQKRQHSGLFSEEKIAEIGRLTGAQALISGTISSASSNDTYFRESRTREKCDTEGKNCQRQSYSVSCTARVIGLGVQIRMVDVERGDMVTAQSFNETESTSACRDRNEALPSREQGLERLSARIVDQFLARITPGYTRFDVVLLDDPDIDLTGEQEARFEAALAFIEAGRHDRAEQLLDQLHRDVRQQSFAIAYNLGVIRESGGDYQSAKTLYLVADRLTLEPVEEINAALHRIDRLARNSKRAMSQLNRE